MTEQKKFKDSYDDKPLFFKTDEKLELEKILLAILKSQQDDLKTLLVSIIDHAYEDTVYRFYTRSCKLYHHAPYRTGEIVEALRRLAPPGTILDPEFEEIILAGGKDVPFSPASSSDWEQHSRPLIEAFFHARYFLEMAVKYWPLLKSRPYMPWGCNYFDSIGFVEIFH